MSKELIRLIDEDLDVLRQTLNNFKRMKTTSIDKEGEEIARRNKKEFIQATLDDIKFMLDLRRKITVKTNERTA